MGRTSPISIGVSRSVGFLGLALLVGLGVGEADLVFGDGDTFRSGNSSQRKIETGPPSLPGTGDGVYSSGLLELGDGQPPPGMPGLADILPDAAQIGPDWADLFDAGGLARDDFPPDGAGNPVGNGVPDYRELYNGRWAVFAADDVSLGSGSDGTVRSGNGGVIRGVAQPDHDIGNAYVYSTIDSVGNPVIFAAVERLGAGDSTLEFEFSQEHMRLGHGGYGVGVPWEIDGDLQEHDVLLTLTFSGGQLTGAEASVRNNDAWLPVTSVVGEGCDESEWLCALGNASVIDGGPWTNHDTGSDPEQISVRRFAEIGINVGALLGVRPAFKTVCVRTPEDLYFGYFAEGR